MAVAIVDAGLGNVRSIQRMIEHVGGRAVILAEPDALATHERIILPGVGAFDHGMALLTERGWLAPLAAARAAGVPVLGICLGMQLLCRGSEEGELPGLGWIAADVRRIVPPPGSLIKVPHVGWSPLDVRRATALLPAEELRFYFVHSYHAVCDDPADLVATVDHGGAVAAAIARGNVHGVQFHPEKSHRYGMGVMRRFLELPCPAVA